MSPFGRCLPRTVLALVRGMLGVGCWMLTLLPSPAATHIDVTRDNSIVLYPGEYHLNAGKQERIRIKEYLERSISGMYRALEREKREADSCAHEHRKHKVREQAA